MQRFPSHGASCAISNDNTHIEVKEKYNEDLQ
jgi:hypothetical protein